MSKAEYVDRTRALEILQKNAMWVLGIFTGAACAVSFGVQHVWASMVLNLYYVGVSFYGLRAWKKAGVQAGENVIHLRPLPSRASAPSPKARPSCGGGASR